MEGSLVPGAGAQAGHLCRGVAPSGQSEPKRTVQYKSESDWDEEGICARWLSSTGYQSLSRMESFHVGKAWCRVKKGPCRGRPTVKRLSPSGVMETRMCGVAWPGVSEPEQYEEGSTWRTLVWRLESTA